MSNKYDELVASAKDLLVAWDVDLPAARKRLRAAISDCEVAPPKMAWGLEEVEIPESEQAWNRMRRESRIIELNIDGSGKAYRLTQLPKEPAAPINICTCGAQDRAEHRPHESNCGVYSKPASPDDGKWVVYDTQSDSLRWRGCDGWRRALEDVLPYNYKPYHPCGVSVGLSDARRIETNRLSKQTEAASAMVEITVTEAEGLHHVFDQNFDKIQNIKYPERSWQKWMYSDRNGFASPTRFYRSVKQNEETEPNDVT